MQKIRANTSLQEIEYIIRDCLIDYVIKPVYSDEIIEFQIYDIVYPHGKLPQKVVCLGCICVLLSARVPEVTAEVFVDKIQWAFLGDPKGYDEAYNRYGQALQKLKAELEKIGEAESVTSNEEPPKPKIYQNDIQAELDKKFDLLNKIGFKLRGWDKTLVRMYYYNYPYADIANASGVNVTPEAVGNRVARLRKRLGEYGEQIFPLRKKKK